MALTIAPIVMFVAAFKMLEPHDYPAGDIRNEPLFWIALGLALLFLGGALIVGSIRTLRER